MSRPRKHEMVLAVYPSTRGLGFAVFEGPLAPLDWGVKDIRGRYRNARSFEAAKRLIESHAPDVLVFEDSSDPLARRAIRSHRLQHLIASYARAQMIDICTFTRTEIRACFKPIGAVTRYEIAQAIAGQIDAFAHRLPPPRSAWKSEDARLTLFCAASLAITFYGREQVAENPLSAATP